MVRLLQTPHAAHPSETLGTGKDVLGPSISCSIHQRVIASALNLASLPPLINYSEAAGYIGNLTMLKDPNHAGAIIVADMLQSSPINPLPLAVLYVSKRPDDPEDVIGGRILNPEWIDRGLPAMWKESCTRLHNGLCKSFPVQKLSSMRPTWLVDVHRQCLIAAPDGCSYVALSYVWGSQKTLLAMKSNHDLLRLAGSLTLATWEPPISITTRHAMGIVGLLGERYLWVDTLCIVQDEDSQKKKELSKMSGIYANASVTIMAVQGGNANSGLRGFRSISEPRNLRQVVHFLNGGMKVVQLPVQGHYYEVACKDSAWPTRAWTYQEHLCSRRKLIFDGDSLRWECMEAVWREHVEWTTRLHPHHDNITSCQSMFQSLIPDFSGFQRILREYNSRSFTYPEDALDAFAGISSAISLAVGGSLISGLPAAWFDICLLWSPEKSVLRRIALASNNNKCLPSWSWAGWSGPVKMDVASGSDFLRNSPRLWMWMMSSARVVRLVSWKYHETLESPGTVIQPVILRSREDWLDGRVECTSEWTRHDISESPEAKYETHNPRSAPLHFFRHSKHPEFEFWYPIPLPEPAATFSVVNPPYISCKTYRAWLFPAERIRKLYGYPPLFSLRDKDRRWVGALEPLVGIDESGETMKEQSTALELVEIAKGYCRNTTSPHPGLQEIDHPDKPYGGEWYHYYWVMWVEWKHGIAYRKGVGRVCMRMWDVQSRSEVDLILG
ncbi:heterokaryon incompatibility protein [Metarhizium guizhouense ARSEF 977]|uniref:Heterokaryon incompatibility protein n=1 Tax=Metarhizium guizhouense (strain ARSEF 977) TaxID=1276136 RepID=A0A0B4GFV1_METGA|nr:heterokaryon incompatibility protein [Metarhizium guizhouense ARSEF 977]